MKITVCVFAALKTYFNAQFEMDTNASVSIEQLKGQLIELNPMAEPVIDRCRFAIGNDFVSPDYVIQHEERVCIIPPSSGG